VDFFLPVAFLRPVDFFLPVAFLRPVDFFLPVAFLRPVDFFLPVAFLRPVVFFLPDVFLRAVDFLRPVAFFLPVDFLRVVAMRGSPLARSAPPPDAARYSLSSSMRRSIPRRRLRRRPCEAARAPAMTGRSSARVRPYEPASLPSSRRVCRSRCTIRCFIVGPRTRPHLTVRSRAAQRCRTAAHARVGIARTRHTGTRIAAIHVPPLTATQLPEAS
jgi:hypothetical protein